MRSEASEQKELWEQLASYKKAIVQSTELHKGWPENEANNFLARERKIPSTRRTYEEIAEAYNLNEYQLEEILKGNTVLDVGSSYADLAMQAKSRNVYCRIVSVDPDYGSMRFMNRIEKNIYSINMSNRRPALRAVGVGENLPFPDNMFDKIFATYSLPVWSNSIAQIDRFIRECFRVSRLGGKIYITPITDIFHRPQIVTTGKWRMEERDEIAVRLLKNIQIFFIQLLEDLQEKSIAEICLARNPIQEASTHEEMKRIPFIAVIKAKKKY